MAGKAVLFDGKSKSQWIEEAFREKGLDAPLGEIESYLLKHSSITSINPSTYYLVKREMKNRKHTPVNRLNGVRTPASEAPPNPEPEQQEPEAGLENTPPDVQVAVALASLSRQMGWQIDQMKEGLKLLEELQLG